MKTDREMKSDTQPEVVAELVGQAVVDKTVDKVEAGKTSAASKPLTDEIMAGLNADNTQKPQLGQHNHAKKEGKSVPLDRKVTIMIAAGLGSVVLGLIMLFLAASLGIILVLVGAGILTFGVYKPISQKMAKLPVGGQK